MMRFGRVLGLVCGGILVGALGSLAGCSSAEEPKGATAETISSASVALTLHDANGTRVGSGSGILIAPRLVLTSAHLVAGKARWTVKTIDGKTVNGVRGLTYDWMVYGSNKSHPRKHDVAVIYLDQPIDLPAYPKLAATKLASGSKATRIRGTGASFEQIATSLETVRTFPHSYVTDMENGELLDTGGAVVNDRNEIVGLVTGRGLTTGKLYVARTDALVGWLSPKLACGGAATGIRTYGVPGGDGGGASSSSSSGSTGGTSGSSGSSGSYGTPPPGSSGSSGDGSGGGSCYDGGGNCSGDCGSGGNDGVPPDSSSSSSSSGSSGTSGSSGSSGSTGTIPGSSGSSGTSGSSGDGSSGSTGTIPGSSGSSGSSGTSSGGTSGSSGSSTIPGSSGGGGTDVPGGDGDACTGENDNPELCPPEPDGCTGESCGGGVPDDSIDYGGCACGGNSDGIIVR